MKVSLHIVEERRRRVAAYLEQHSYAPLREVCARFEMSEATARRDLVVLAERKQIVRTHGGALTEYNRRFPSFRERETLRAEAKRKIAAAARDLVLPGTTCFLDFGTTAFALAEELRRRPPHDLRVVTNNLPAAELLTAAPGVRVYLLGGELLPRQSVLLGGAAFDALRYYSIDQAFLSAEAADAAGVWNSQRELVALQQAVMQHAAASVLCIDASKLQRTAPAFLAPWSGFRLAVTDATRRRVKSLSPACGMRHV